MVFGLIFILLLVVSGYGYYEYQKPDEVPYPQGVFQVTEKYEIERTRGWPNQKQFQFDAYSPGNHYELRVNTDRVSSGTIFLNSQKVLDSWELKRNHSYYEKSISLQDSNYLTLRIAGKKGTSYTAEVVGFDNEAPNISYNLDPTPNELGWHNDTVAINWECADEISDIASCSSPVSIESEGAGQIVEGEAVDNAQNATQLQAEINIDKTSPVISTLLSSSANKNGWHNEDVQVDFECDDTLSGIKSCSDPILVAIEGENTDVKGTAIDNADNVKDISHKINLDKTTPTITPQMSAQANANGWYKEPITVSYSCNDELSGIEVCSDPVILAQEGMGLIATGYAVDQASNRQEYVSSLNIDYTNPIVEFRNIDRFGLIPNNGFDLQILVFDNIKLDPSFLNATLDSEPLHCNIQGALVICPNLNLDNTKPYSLTVNVRDMAGNLAQASQEVALDLDGDGVPEYSDQCLSTQKDEEVDENGCSYSQRDDDKDGVVNGRDQCLNTDSETAVASDGCDPSQRDTDKDGIVDIEDDFPTNPNESKDTDFDGIGDNADDDIDGDGFTNEEELAAGSDPYSKDSIPSLAFTVFEYSASKIEQVGQHVNVQWQTQGANEVELISEFNNIAEKLPKNGNVQIYPEVTTNYTLRAIGPQGVSSRNFEIQVALPQPKSLWPESVQTNLFESTVNASLTLSEDGVSYFGDYDGNYTKLSNNGQVVWQLSGIGIVNNKSLFDDQSEGLYIASDTKETSSFNAGGQLLYVNSEGEIVWTVETSQPVIASPVYFGNHIVVVDYQGAVYKVKKDGSIISTLELGDDHRFTKSIKTIPNTGQATLLSKSGQLFKLDLEAMTVVWQKSLLEAVQGTGK